VAALLEVDACNITRRPVVKQGVEALTVIAWPTSTRTTCGWTRSAPPTPP
jgi:hypothetical protein